MIDGLWEIDRKLLVEIVRQIEVDGDDFADTEAAIEKAGVDPNVGNRSVERLVRNGMLDGSATFGGNWVIGGVTEKGLRESGAWPTVDQLAAVIVAALAQAADNEPEPERKGKFRRAADSIASVGQKTFTEVLASYLAKATGVA